MTSEELRTAALKQQGGVLLDTNVLVLYLIELAEIGAYRSFKRTKQFTPDHLEALALAIKFSKRLVTTPHILAEAWNLG